LAFLCLTCVFSYRPAAAQQRVDSRQRYERVWCVLPVTGKGTFDDPRRPLYAPTSPDAVNPKTGVIGMSWVLSDDGKLALVEFVARSRAAFAPVLADSNPSTKVFIKGVHKEADIRAEFLKHKANFDFSHFGTRLP
jgi:hypothetical protein